MAISISKIKRSQASKERVELSVLIPIRNEEENIPDLLSKFEEQEFNGNVELIFINDRSSDVGRELIEEFEFSKCEKKILDIDQVPEGISPKKNAIKQGITEARFQNLLLMDGDCIPRSKIWIQEMGSEIEKSGLAIGLGNYFSGNSLLSKMIQWDTFLTSFQMMGWAGLSLPYMSLGRNWGFKKDLFVKVKGFEGISHIQGGDDDLLFQKMVSIHTPGLVVGKNSGTLSQPSTNLKEYFHQKTRHQRSSLYYSFQGKVIGSFMGFNVLVLLLIFSLLLLGYLDLWVGMILIGIRYLFSSISILISKRILGVSLSLFLDPILEILHAFMLLGSFFASLFVSNSPWKKEGNFPVRH